MPTIAQNIQSILDTVPGLYRGPGGAVAVLHNGEVVGQKVWGYADLNKRVHMTEDMLMPICSITKQMICALLIQLERDPPAPFSSESFKDELDKGLHRILRDELFHDTGLTLRHLCHNQSGIRDYWAMTTLWGAKPEDQFLISKHAPLALDRTRSLHFKPGSEYSYCNLNFHVVARLIESLTKKPIGDLLTERIFKPAGMATAKLCPDTANLPSPCVGYEGSERYGFFPAQNRIEWSGDAGVVASLADMIAYERYLDQCWSDPNSWYRVAAEPPTFDGGKPAYYGYGLSRASIGDLKLVGHGGALRGFRLQRWHIPTERLSVVAMFNHEADTDAATDYILKKALKQPQLPQPLVDQSSADWVGVFLDEDTKLLITISNGSKGKLKITYENAAESLTLTDSYSARSPFMIAEIHGDLLSIHCLNDNHIINANRLVQSLGVEHVESVVGKYHCAEVDSTFLCEGQGSILYGSFDGFLGRGPEGLMRHVGGDVWALACPRGMDAPAPGDWTVVFNKDQHGTITGFTIGCWLARKIEFVRILES